MENSGVVVLAAKRTPIGAFGGAFKNITAVQLAALLSNAMLKENAIKKSDINKAFFGNAISAGLGQNPARQIALNIGINCPADTISKVCGSGMSAVILGAQTILLGEAELVLCGGTENMSLAPHIIKNFRQIAKKQFGDCLMVDIMEKDGLTDAFSGKKMVEIADKCASMVLSRAFMMSGDEKRTARAIQDFWACLSYERAIGAQKNGSFLQEIAAINYGHGLVDQDEGTLKYNREKISRLEAIIQPCGTITAANSSQISDGAAILLLSSREYDEKIKLKPIAEIIDWDSITGDPEEFPVLPARLIEKYFGKKKISHQDIDLFEINEAFAMVPAYTQAKVGIPAEKINIHGGAVALGHPLGASGARIAVTLIHALHKYGKRRGIAVICIGGGEALLLDIKISD